MLTHEQVENCLFITNDERTNLIVTKRKPREGTDYFEIIHHGVAKFDGSSSDWVNLIESAPVLYQELTKCRCFLEAISTLFEDSGEAEIENLNKTLKEVEQNAALAQSLALNGFNVTADAILAEKAIENFKKGVDKK